jgi:hypothetical protein
MPSQTAINIVLTGSNGGTNDPTHIYISSGSSITNSAAALVLAINNSSSLSPYNTSISNISASNSTTILNLYAKTSGINGNSYQITSGSNTYTFSGAYNRTNDSSHIYVLSGSSATNSTAALVLAINNSSSLSPYNTSISDISASNSTTTLNLYAKTRGTTGNSNSVLSGSTFSNFTGGTGDTTTSSPITVLTLDRSIPNSPALNINHFVVRRKSKDVNNGITLGVKLNSSDDTGILLPEYPTQKLKDNLPTIIQNLSSKNLI